MNRWRPSICPVPWSTRIEDELDGLDPTADLEVVLDCATAAPAGRSRWTRCASPGRTLESTARRLATDVHVLARAYGWSEREILALSPFRRHLYLSAVEP